MKRKIWKQKSILALLTGVLMLALAFVVDVPGKTAYAEDATEAATEGTIGNVTWSFNPYSNCLDFYGYGAIPDYNNLEDRPWNAFKDQITKVYLWADNEKPISPIGKNAFADLPYLYEVNIYTAVKEIHSGAFKNCPNLTDVRVPNDAKGKVAKDAFDANTKITYYCTHSSRKMKYKSFNITPATLTQSGRCDTDAYCADCGEHQYTIYNGTIQPASRIYVEKTANTYTGKAIAPTVVVRTFGGDDLFKNEDYTLSYASGRKNVGSYTVTVKGKYRYKFTKKLTFTINPKGTEISKLSAGKKAFTAKLKKQSTQTTGYELSYSTSCKFTKAATKSKSITSYKTTTKKITGLKKGKTYYVKVRTYKTVKGKKYYSGWSKVKTVKVK